MELSTQQSTAKQATIAASLIDSAYFGQQQWAVQNLVRCLTLALSRASACGGLRVPLSAGPTPSLSQSTATTLMHSSCCQSIQLTKSKLQPISIHNLSTKLHSLLDYHSPDLRDGPKYLLTAVNLVPKIASCPYLYKTTHCIADDMLPGSYPTQQPKRTNTSVHDPDTDRNT